VKEPEKETGKEPVMQESWWTRSSSARPYVFALLVGTGLLLEIVIHYYLHITVVYTQFFYLIVVIAGLWYGRKAILVALFFGGLQVLVSFVITGSVSFESVIRATMLCLVAVVIGSIVEQMNNYHDMLKDQNKENSACSLAFSVANKKLNLLSSITRHDILNQLTILIGYLELSKDEIKQPEILAYVDREMTAADTIRRQIAFTKTYEEIGVNAPEWQNVSDKIKALTSLTHYQGISFKNALQSLEIYADPMLEKIFENLIDNSVRHGEHVSEISFSYIHAGEDILIVYEDNGVGIPDNEKDLVFRKGVGKNTGFGLFLTREILSITGLSIKENGTYGKGARFEITVHGGKFRFATDTMASRS
jgi:signal transduction histidine kinase